MSQRASKGVIALVFLAMFAFQGVQLDCDPSPAKRFDDVGDEGLWQHNARCKVLFGSFLLDDVNQDVFAAPLFTAVQWMVFCLLGVSIFTARLVCLLSLWLILVMLYTLIRRESSAGKAVFVVAMLGLMHETLMHTKWSTPILPEMCFLTAVLFFWELGRLKHPCWMLAAGVSLIAAMAVKFTSIYFCVPMLLFVSGAYWLRRDIDGRRLVMFAGGAAAAATPLACLFWLNPEEFQFFMQTIGKVNWARPISLNQSLAMCLLHHEQFISPGVAILLMLTFLWLLDRVMAVSRHGFRAAVRNLSPAEFYALCWLAGSLAVLVAAPNPTYRRLIMLYVPLTILAGSYAFQQLAPSADRPDETRCGIASISSGMWRGTLWVLTTCVWWSYARMAVHYVGNTWPNTATATVPGSIDGVVLVVCAAVAAVFFLCRASRTATALLVGLFFAVSLAFNAIWCRCATYTIRDASRAIAQDHAAGPFLVGTFCFQLAMENQSLPICDPWIPWVVEISPFNPWFADVCDRCEFLMSVDDTGPDSPINSAFRVMQTKASSVRLEPVRRIPLCPIPFSGGYKYRETLYRVSPLLHAPASWDECLRSIRRACGERRKRGQHSLSGA